MKSTYIIIALVTITLGAIWFTSGSEDPSQVPTVSEKPEVKEAEDMGMTAEEHATMTGNGMVGGTDVGMEMPIPDMPNTTEMQMNPNAKVFTMLGNNFAFNQKEIRVKQGDTVTINFTSTDGFHDWVLDEFGAQTEKIKTGESTSVTFVADKTGTFEYYCSIGSHRANGMVGKLVVE